MYQRNSFFASITTLPTVGTCLNGLSIETNIRGLLYVSYQDISPVSKKGVKPSPLRKICGLHFQRIQQPEPRQIFQTEDEK